MSILILCAGDDLPDSSFAINCMAWQEKWIQPANGLRGKIIEAVKPTVEEIEVCDTVHRLIARFHQPKVAPAVLILVIDGQQTLESLISVRDLFDGIPVIVILTGEDPQTLRRTYTLGPRYISHGDDLDHVAEVLANLTAR
ncbi:MAG: hypothetical protein GY737_04230 [Desulfobacteraceae bacterium]|nr:hypothetical protein [Desulfobacteraceae bacterium]